ncbi:MAG: hypothetical protein NTW69_00760 [Chloroflexi bacterium]|nr:hypothetical protein [Chloroflexota bacterium]
MVVEHSIEQAKENVTLYFIIGFSSCKIQLSRDYKLTTGKGATLAEGKDAVMFAYVLSCIHDALLANELLVERDIGLKVVNLPWVNRVDIKGLRKAIEPYNLVFVLENHRSAGALAEHIFDLLSASRNQPLARRHLERFAVEGWPVCGSPQEVLKFHKLDGASLAEHVFEYIDIL